MNAQRMSAAEDFREEVGTRKFATVLADPPWRFQNKTGKVAPEHKRLARYPTLTFAEIENLPVKDVVEETAPLYLWVPNALLSEGLQVMKRWGFQYKTNLIWYKARQDGGPDRRGVGFYFQKCHQDNSEALRGGQDSRNESCLLYAARPARKPITSVEGGEKRGDRTNFLSVLEPVVAPT